MKAKPHDPPPFRDLRPDPIPVPRRNYQPRKTGTVNLATRIPIGRPKHHDSIANGRQATGPIGPPAGGE